MSRQPGSWGPRGCPGDNSGPPEAAALCPPCPLAGAHGATTPALALPVGLAGDSGAGPRRVVYRDSRPWLTARRQTKALTQGAGLYGPQASLARRGGRLRGAGGGDSAARPLLVQGESSPALGGHPHPIPALVLGLKLQPSGPGAASLRLTIRPAKALTGHRLSNRTSRGTRARATLSTPPTPTPQLPAPCPAGRTDLCPARDALGPAARWLEADPGPGKAPPSGLRWAAGGPAHLGCRGAGAPLSWLGVWLPCHRHGALRSSPSLCLGGRGPMFLRPLCFLSGEGSPPLPPQRFPSLGPLTHPQAQGPSQPALPHWPDWFAWRSPAHTPPPTPSAFALRLGETDCSHQT